MARDNIAQALIFIRIIGDRERMPVSSDSLKIRTNKSIDLETRCAASRAGIARARAIGRESTRDRPFDQADSRSCRLESLRSLERSSNCEITRDRAPDADSGSAEAYSGALVGYTFAAADVTPTRMGITVCRDPGGECRCAAVTSHVRP